MKHLIAFLLFLSPSLVIAQSCDLPAAYGGLNTGSNMSILLHQDFLSNLELNTSSAYIVAITESNLVVGSKSLVDEDGEIVFPACSDPSITAETECINNNTWANGVCSDPSITDETECINNNRMWGLSPLDIFLYNDQQGINAAQLEALL